MANSNQQSRIITGILLMICCITLFSIKDAIAKHLSDAYPVIEILFFQYLVMMVIVLPITVFKGNWNFYQQPNKISLLFRGFLGVSAVGLLFYSFSMIPLADATALIFVSPIVVTVLSPYFLGEKVGLISWLTTLVGFIGVLLIIQPGFETFNVGTLVALLSGILFGLYGIATRKLTFQHRTEVMMLYTSLVGVFAVGVFLPFNWAMPVGLDWLVIVLVGVISSSGHALMVLSYANAPATIVTPFLYTSIIVATALGYYVFGDFPNLVAWIGITIIITSGIYLGIRESSAQ